MRQLLTSTFLIFIVGCGATIDSTRSANAKSLRNYNKIYVNLVNSSGGTTMNTINLNEIGIGTKNLMKGDEQVKQSLESFQFELMKIGFEFVGSLDDADAYIDFTIGQIRYDPLTGWIADQATAKFQESESGKIIAYFKTEPRFITPTTKTLIEKLSSAIKSEY